MHQILASEAARRPDGVAAQHGIGVLEVAAQGHLHRGVGAVADVAEDDERVAAHVAHLAPRDVPPGGPREDTLVVVTADHAGQTGERFQGRFDGFPPPDGNACDPATGSTGIRSDCNWYLGQDADERYLDPSPAVAQLRNALAGNLAFSYQDGHVAVWLNDDSEQKKREAAAAVLKMPGVIASYRINESNSDYRLSGVNRMDRRERAWFQRYGERLVDTMAAPNGPQVVGLVASDVTYGAVGDHGGHSRLIQNIPMVFYGAGVGSRDSGRDIRLVDVLPTVLEEMGIDYDEDDFDGEAVRLSGRR